MKNKIIYCISMAAWFISSLFLTITVVGLAGEGEKGILPLILTLGMYIVIYLGITIYNAIAIAIYRASKDFKKGKLFYLELFNLVLPLLTFIFECALYRVLV